MVKVKSVTLAHGHDYRFFILKYSNMRDDLFSLIPNINGPDKKDIRHLLVCTYAMLCSSSPLTHTLNTNLYIHLKMVSFKIKHVLFR